MTALLLDSWRAPSDLSPISTDIGVAHSRGASRAARWAVTALVFVPVLWWAGPGVEGVGGRDLTSLLVQSLLLVPALLAVRPWRCAGGGLLTTISGLALAALLVCVASPLGWRGAGDAASYASLAGLVLLVTSWATSTARRHAVLVVVLLAAVHEFTLAFLPWWGGRDPARKMIGTFYWHNPFAAFLLPAAVLALAFVVRGVRPWALVGWVAAPLCAAGIVFSTSRSTLGVLALGWLVVVVALVRDGGSLRRAATVTTLATAAAFLLAGPPFFSTWHHPFEATWTRSHQDGQSLTNNGNARVSFDRQAVAAVADRPLVGAGYRSLALVSPGLAPAPEGRSPFAHNGLLQPWVDGGALLGIPCTVALLAVARAAWRRLRRWHTDVLVVPVVVALGCATAHSAVDFDWSHPSNLHLVGVLTGVLLAIPVNDGVERQARARAYAWPSVVGVGLLVAVLSVAAGAVQTRRVEPALLTAARGADGPRQVALLRQEAVSPFSAGEDAAAVLRQLLPPVAARRDLRGDPRLEPALAGTARVAQVDRRLRLARDRALALSGREKEAVADVRQLLMSLGSDATAYVGDAATVVAAAGQQEAAVDLLLPTARAAAFDPARAAAYGVGGDALVVLARLAPTGEAGRCAAAALDAATRATLGDVAGLAAPATDCSLLRNGPAWQLQR